MLCNAATLFRALKAFDASIGRTASVLLALRILRFAWIAASLPLFYPAKTWREPLASTTSGFVTIITHFPIILRITSSTPIGRTAPSPLSRGISRLAKIAWILRGSIHSVHKRLVIVAIDALRPVPDLFNNFDARILRNPFASTLEGTPRSFCPKGCVPYHFPIYLLENCVWDVLHWPVKQRTQAVFLWTWVFISELCHDVVSYRQDTSPIIFTEITQSRVDLPWHNKVRKPFPALIRWINPSRVAEALLNHKSFAQ